MLSQKLQDDLMTAYQKVYEEKRGHAAGASDIEKQASQLASDVRYKARGKSKPGASKEELRKLFLSILGSSPAPQAVKSMAKEKLLGEGKVEDYRKAGNLSREAISVGSNTKKGQDIMKQVNKMTKKMNKDEVKEGKMPEGLKNYLMKKGKKDDKKEDKKEEMKKESVDLFDIVKGKLIDEGVDEKEALKIMINLSEDELNKISEGMGAALVGGALATGMALKGLQMRNKMKNDAKKRDMNTPAGKIQSATDAKNKMLKDAGMGGY